MSLVCIDREISNLDVTFMKHAETVMQESPHLLHVQLRCLVFIGSRFLVEGMGLNAQSASTILTHARKPETLNLKRKLLTS